MVSRSGYMKKIIDNIMKKLQPKKIKYKKVRKKKLREFEYKSTRVKFGSIGLKAAEPGLLSATQIEAARQGILKKIKRKAKLWIRVFPHTPVTKKPTEARMGKGKGSISHWVAKVKAGKVLFEIHGGGYPLAASAFKTAANKLCVKTRIFL